MIHVGSLEDLRQRLTELAVEVETLRRSSSNLEEGGRLKIVERSLYDCLEYLRTEEAVS